MPTKIITVKPGGAIEFIYDDHLAGLLKQGKATIERASHVEVGDSAQGQDPLAWYASMIDGPVLGPYSTRQAALDAEVDWINQNVLTRAVVPPHTPGARASLGPERRSDELV